MLDGSTFFDDNVFTPEVVTRSELHARFLRRKRDQSAWDAEEARDLRIAERTQHWTHYGCVTLLEYLEVICHIEPRTALDRIRVSHALADLSLLEAELEDGSLGFSHVKELVRILVPDTESAWIAHTRGMTYREIQRAVAGHARGDLPTDPTHPDERRQFVGFHVKASTRARFHALLRALEDERGDRFVDDDDRLNAICDRLEVTVCDRHEVTASTNASTETNGAAQTSTCRGCASTPTQVWITTDGHAFANGTELDDAELAAVTCDATIMGHVDDPTARPEHLLTPKQRKRILARDMNQCRVPGCRARHHLDVHHIIHREHGGDNSDPNLVTLCSGHHRLHHAGFLEITGHAPDQLEFRRTNADEEPSRPRGRDVQAVPRRERGI